MPKSRIFLTTFLLVSLWFTPLVAVTPVRAEQTGMELTPTADSTVWSEGPDGNLGGAFELRVERFIFSNVSEELAFLMFDLSQVPAGAVIDQAKLRLYAGAVDVKASVSVYYCSSNSWTEEGITYNNKPSFDSAPLDTANVTSRGWYEWNVTSAVKSRFAGSDKKLSLIIKADTRGAVMFYSRTNPSVEDRPYLYVLYQPPPPSTDNTALTTLIILISVGAVAVGLGATYMLRKRRKPPSTTQTKTITAKTVE